MDWFSSVKNFFVGTERVKKSKADCKEKKRIAEEKYNADMKKIDEDCATDLEMAKQADKALQPQSDPTVITKPVEAPISETPSTEQPNRIGGKKGGKSKKRSKSNRKKTARKH
jgi:hypothetical protein